MPQFAGAKLHLIYQITKILADFLRKIVHFVAFSPFSSSLKLYFLLKIMLLDAGVQLLSAGGHHSIHRTRCFPQPFQVFAFEIRRKLFKNITMIGIKPFDFFWLKHAEIYRSQVDRTKREGFHLQEFAEFRRLIVFYQ